MAKLKDKKGQEVWFKGILQAKQSDRIMLCFPFAGGGASAYYGWQEKMPSDIVVCPVQLPGREERITETPYVVMQELVEDIVTSLKNIENELILFGHSMGAKIAYEVEKRLEQDGRNASLLVVSGSRAPHIPEPNPIYHLEEKEFSQALARFEGTPKEILDNEVLFHIFLPMLKADFEMDETYCETERKQVSCSVLALGGDTDSEAMPDEIIMWKEYTQETFSHEVFPGGHFFIREKEDEVMQVLKRYLRNM